MTPTKLTNGNSQSITKRKGKRHWRVILLLDFDSFGDYRAFPEKARFLIRTFGLRMDHCRLRRRRSHSGKWHAVILYKCVRLPPPAVIVAAQAILGSDSRRETFNLLRAVRLKSAPEAWQLIGRWNTLYERKYETALTGADVSLRRKLPRAKPDERENGRMTIDRRKFEMRERVMPEELKNHDKLLPGSLRGAKSAVVTITHAVQVDAKRGEDRSGRTKYEPAIALAYKEFPKRIHWLNKMGVNILCDVFGDEESEWVGNVIPIVVKEDVPNPTDGGTSDMLWIANQDEWQSLFDADAEARAKTTSKPANPAAAAARKAAEARKGGSKTTGGGSAA